MGRTAVVGTKNPRLQNKSKGGRAAGDKWAGQHAAEIQYSRPGAEAATQQAAGGPGKGGRAAGSR